MGCPNCGALQTLSPEAGATVAIRGVCRSVLERSGGRSPTAALACAMATLLPKRFVDIVSTAHQSREPDRFSRSHSSLWSAARVSQAIKGGG